MEKGDCHVPSLLDLLDISSIESASQNPPTPLRNVSKIVFEKSMLDLVQYISKITDDSPALEDHSADEDYDSDGEYFGNGEHCCVEIPLSASVSMSISPYVSHHAHHQRSWIVYAEAAGLDVNSPLSRSSIFAETRILASLTELVDECSRFASPSLDYDKAREARSVPISDFLDTGSIDDRLFRNLESLRSNGNVLNTEQIIHRVHRSDPNKQKLLSVAAGRDLAAHSSVHAVDAPVKDCTDLEFHHAISLLKSRRAVLCTQQEFAEQIQEHESDCFACLFSIVPKTGKGKPTLGRHITDMSHETGNSLNGPRVSGKLLTSREMALTTGEIINPDHASIAGMFLDALKWYGDDACGEVRDVSNAHHTVPIAIATMKRCALYLRTNGQLFIMLMAVSSMGLFASAFLWEVVKVSIVFEAERRATEYDIPFPSVMMCVDDRLRVAKKDFFMRDREDDNAFFGIDEMGILGKNSISDPKHQEGRIIDYTGHIYDLDTATASLSYSRFARIIHTWIFEVGWSRANDCVPYKRFMKIAQYTFTLQDCIPFLSHFHCVIIRLLKNFNTQSGTDCFVVKLTTRAAQALNVFLLTILCGLSSDKIERWRVPLRFAYLQHRPRGLDIRDETYGKFVDQQIKGSDFRIVVDAGGGSRKLGVYLYPSMCNGCELPGAFARIDTSNWWPYEVDIYILELLAGIYGILLALAHFKNPAPAGLIVHLQTDNSVALAGHLRGTTNSSNRRRAALLRPLYALRALLLEQSLLLFSFSYIHTLSNSIADPISRDEPPCPDLLLLLQSCTEYGVPPLYP